MELLERRNSEIQTYEYLLLSLYVSQCFVLELKRINLSTFPHLGLSGAAETFWRAALLNVENILLLCNGERSPTPPFESDPCTLWKSYNALLSFVPSSIIHRGEVQCPKVHLRMSLFSLSLPSCCWIQIKVSLSSLLNLTACFLFVVFSCYFREVRLCLSVQPASVLYCVPKWNVQQCCEAQQHPQVLVQGIAGGDKRVKGWERRKNTQSTESLKTVM